jgi:hypothetical protein
MPGAPPARRCADKIFIPLLILAAVTAPTLATFMVYVLFSNAI